MLQVKYVPIYDYMLQMNTLERKITEPYQQKQRQNYIVTCLNQCVPNCDFSLSIIQPHAFTEM